MADPQSPQLPRADNEPRPPGWRISPAPDGRGAPPPPQQPQPWFRGRRFLIIVGLLAANYLTVVLLAPGPHERIQVPYSPFFLQQVQAGNVKSISSRGETVQGEFKHAVRYPPTGSNSKTATRFGTEVPTFADTKPLSKLLTDKQVIVNAKPTEQQRSFIETLLLGFGPTLLLVGLFIFFARRGPGTGIMSFGRSRARRSDGTGQQVTFADVAGIDE